MYLFLNKSLILIGVYEMICAFQSVQAQCKIPLHVVFALHYLP